jgi:hypothetical protein
MASRKIKRTMKKTMKRSNKMAGGSRKKKAKKTKKKGSNWMKCLGKARKELGLKGFVTINKGKDGVALYKRAKEICGK